MYETKINIDSNIIVIKNSLKKIIESFYPKINKLDKENINYLIEKLQNNNINFVVVGQFKRGKSTFINSILGEEVLPTAVLPLTSIITIVKFNPEKKAIVSFLDGKEKNIEIYELTNYISEIENPENIKNVKYVEVGYPNYLLKKGITFIDTPGIGSLHKNNTTVTYEYIPKIDAAIFITSPDPVLSEYEINFLDDIFNITEKVFFVLNKIDYLNEEELKEVKKYTNNIIKSKYNKFNFHLFPVSSKRALFLRQQSNIEELNKTGILEFENHIIEYFETEKMNILLQSVKRQFYNIVNKIEIGINLEIKLLSYSLKDLEEKQNILDNNLKVVLDEEQNLYNSIKNDLVKLKNQIKDNISQNINDITKDIKSSIVNFQSDNISLNKNIYNKLIDEKFTNIITTKLEDLRISIGKKLKQEVSNIKDKYISDFNKLIDSIYNIVSNLFDFKFNKIAIDYEVEFPNVFNYITYEFKLMFEIDKSFWAKFLSKKFHNKVITIKYLNRVEYTLNYNLSYIFDSIDRRMDRFHREFTVKLSSDVQDRIEKIKSIISSVHSLKHSEKSKYDDRIERLNSELAEIQNIKDELNNV